MERSTTLMCRSHLLEYEDEVQPYLDVTKTVYKELVSVQKDADTQAIQVVSSVFKVEGLVSVAVQQNLSSL